MNQRITGARSSECRTCHGLGYTTETSAEMETRFEPSYGWVEARTLAQGSGCPACFGTGQRRPRPHDTGSRANLAARMPAQIRRIL